MRRKLFLSFRQALKALVGGQVNIQDLETGLFLFGCTREEVFKSPEEVDPSQLEREAYVHDRLVLQYPERLAALRGALLKAEEEGGQRIRWRTSAAVVKDHDDQVEPDLMHVRLVEDVWWGLLNELLVANGYEPVVPQEGYSPNLVARLLETRPELDVVCYTR